MEKIEKLLDQGYVLSFFNKRILPLYPHFKNIYKIKIVPHKKFIWKGSYHVVIEFKVIFISLTHKNKYQKFSFFCTAHSSEPRKNVYEILNHLWKNGFARGFLTIPRPILYSRHFNASFYRAVDGPDLLDFIKDHNKQEVEKMVIKTAKWLAKFHKIPLSDTIKFDKKNSKIKTVVPGYKNILKDIDSKYDGKYVQDVKSIYDHLIELEEDFFELSNKRWLIHGDVHPQNIIKISDRKMAMIDFADVSSSDFTRDLGTFLQQLEYKLQKNQYSSVFINKMKKAFIETYCKAARIRYNDRLKERIKLYYHWTMARTATYWLTKHDATPEKAEVLIDKLKKFLKI